MSPVRVEPRDFRADPGLIAAEPDAPVPSTTRLRRSGIVVWLAVLACLMAGAVLLVTWWIARHSPAAVESAGIARPAPTQATPSPPAATAEATIEHPIADAGVATASLAPPLPAVADSDPMMHDTLVRLFGAGPANAALRDDRLVERFVATIDNLQRSPVSLRLSPVKPVGGAFATQSDGARRIISPANAARYVPFVHMVEAADTSALVAAYKGAYPLFQQTYQRLGYPEGYFNDRLVATIDDLLAAPEIAGSIELVQPKVLYQFADPDLEARSAGQKILIRMGLDNELRVKAKLREIRKALTARNAKP